MLHTLREFMVCQVKRGENEHTLAKLLAASSLPEISCSGWNSWRYVPVRTSSMTVGCRTSGFCSVNTYLSVNLGCLTR